MNTSLEIISQTYVANRIAEEYQGFKVVREVMGDRQYLTVELDNLQRWRSKEEYADYLRWVANEIEKLP